MAVFDKVRHTGAGRKVVRNKKGKGITGEKRGVFISPTNRGGWIMLAGIVIGCAVFGVLIWAICAVAKNGDYDNDYEN